ncbi:MAG: RNA polymerase sigma factor [Planctomycetota bacterium]
MQQKSESIIFHGLLEAHGRILMGAILRFCGNSHDADDVFQETALRVWRSLSKRPKLHNPRAWLMTIAYHCFIDYRARQSVFERDEDCRDDWRSGPAEQAEQAEQIRQVRSFVAALPEQIRAVVVMHYTGGLSLKQTAQAMGISVGTVKSRLNNGLQRLRKELL